MLTLTYLKISFLVTLLVFIFQFCASFSTPNSSSSSFLRLATVDNIHYGIFSYCYANSSIGCSKKQLGYDNQLYLNQTLGYYSELVFNETETVLDAFLLNEYYMGLIDPATVSTVSVVDYIAFLAAVSGSSVTKYSNFLKAPANNPFAKMLIFHPLACGFAFVNMILHVVFILLFSQNKKVQPLLRFKHLMKVVNVLSVLKWVLPVMCLGAQGADVILFAPHISSLAATNVAFTCLLFLSTQFTTYFSSSFYQEILVAHRKAVTVTEDVVKRERDAVQEQY